MPGDDLRYVLTIVTIFSLTSISAQPSRESERVQVAVFLAFDCPISQKYIPTLNQLYNQYQGSQIEWLFIVPGKHNRQAQQDFIREFGVQFNVQQDPKLLLVKSFGAMVTPEVIIRKKDILYRGAIDNWFYELGQYRQTVTATYAADALKAIQLGNEPDIRETKAIGCPIAIPTKQNHH
jgi:hypothetical protein